MSARATTLINARAAARTEIGGVERWAREMAERLPRLRPGAYAVARPPQALAHRAGHAWEQTVLPARAAAARARLIFSPANVAPLAWPRNVVLIHDLAPLRHPEWYSAPYVAWHRRVVARLARRAVGVVTVSEFSRGEIGDLLGADPGRITVIAPGVGDAFTPRADPERASRALELPRPYVLSVATRSARKNLAALEPLARTLADDGVDLVAAGGTRGYLRGDTARLRTLGYVPEELLPGLYAGAQALVAPSLYEGFGLPCLEAMACGVPVVAADRGGIPEACADAALLVDPQDGDALAKAVTAALNDEGLRSRLRAAGLERARSLTWQRTAERVNALLASLAGD